MDKQIVKVTVSIASYNNAAYIDRCIDSVLNQTYQNLEILIVDDGSKDNTLEIISKYQKDNRVVIIEKENEGLSSVRQRALDEATGDYMCFIDADDYLDPHYVECMLNKLIKDKSDICVCSTKFIDSSGKDLPGQTQSFKTAQGNEPFRTTASEFAVVNNVRIRQLYLSDSWNKMYSVYFLRQSGVKFNMPKGLNGTDTSFNRRVALHAPLYSTVEDELYIHVIYASSAVHRKHKKLLHSYQLIAQNCLSESRSLNTDKQAKDYISAIYQKNLFEVIIDEYKEAESKKECINRLKALRQEHLSFSVGEYDILSKINHQNDIMTRVGVTLLNHSIVLLYMLLRFGSRNNARK